MDQPQSARAASASRAARRSLAEFALPAGGAPSEMPSAAPPAQTLQPVPATRRDKQSVKPIGKGRKTITHEPLKEEQKPAATNLNGWGAEYNVLFHHFEDMSSAAKAATDYQAWLLEQMKINMCAALDCASGLAGVRSRTASVAQPATPEQGTNASSQSADKATPAAARVAETFELLAANINTTLEYARRLVNVKAPSEFVELSTSHARKQLELIMKQTAELGSIPQRLAKSNIRWFREGIG